MYRMRLGCISTLALRAPSGGPHSPAACRPRESRHLAPRGRPVHARSRRDASAASRDLHPVIQAAPMFLIPCQRLTRLVISRNDAAHGRAKQPLFTARRPRVLESPECLHHRLETTVSPSPQPRDQTYLWYSIYFFLRPRTFNGTLRAVCASKKNSAL